MALFIVCTFFSALATSTAVVAEFVRLLLLR